jgi:hypothetical protein
VQPTVYQISVRGRVSQRLGSALDGMRLESGAEETTFIGVIRDQSQLYGRLDRVRDLGLELVSVRPQPPVDSSTADATVELHNDPHQEGTCHEGRHRF